jgi:DNA-binding MarR family transcriptional regulator
MGEEIELETAGIVRRGASRLARRLRSERPEHGLPLLKLNVLAQLSRRGPLSPGELAVAEHVLPQSLTRTLAGLEADGLITRRMDEHDRRRSSLALTTAGLDALRRDMRRRDAWLARTMAERLTPTECELLRLAGELMERLAEAPDGSAPPLAIPCSR